MREDVGGGLEDNEGEGRFGYVGLNGRCACGLRVNCLESSGRATNGLRILYWTHKSANDAHLLKSDHTTLQRIYVHEGRTLRGLASLFHIA